MKLTPNAPRLHNNLLPSTNQTTGMESPKITLFMLRLEDSDFLSRTQGADSHLILWFTMVAAHRSKSESQVDGRADLEW